MTDSKKVLLISTFQPGAYGHVIRQVLDKMGYRVHSFNHRQYLAQYGEEYTNEFLTATASALDPDIILTIKGRGIDPDVIRDLPGLKINWWFDIVSRWGDFHKIVDAYDKYYVVEAGQGHPNMTIGIDPDIHRRIETKDEYYHSDVCFLGTWHRRRSNMIIDITRSMPWTTKIWGNTWNTLAPGYVDKAMYWDKGMMAHSNAKISLNAHYVKGLTPNMRAIEVPCTGTLMISDTGVGLEKCFRKGKEYVAYDSVLDAKRTIMKYLEDVDEREKIAKAAQRKAYKKHLLSDKLEEMFK